MTDRVTTTELLSLCADLAAHERGDTINHELAEEVAPNTLTGDRFAALLRCAEAANGALRILVACEKDTGISTRPERMAIHEALSSLHETGIDVAEPATVNLSVTDRTLTVPPEEPAASNEETEETYPVDVCEGQDGNCPDCVRNYRGRSAKPCKKHEEPEPCQTCGGSKVICPRCDRPFNFPGAGTGQICDCASADNASETTIPCPSCSPSKPKERHFCAACLDPCTGELEIEERFYCRECHTEKTKGELPNVIGSNPHYAQRSAAQRNKLGKTSGG